MTSFTTDNWGYPPFNRASFQNVQQLFPTARISRGPGPITNLSGAGDNPRLDLAQLSYTGLDDQPRSVADMITDTYTDAFLVGQGSTLLHEQYFANELASMQPHSLHLLNSVTKSLVGMLAGIQIENGLLRPDDLVATHVPELDKGAFSNTRVRHLLDMTAAVAFGEDYADPQADFWHETAVVGWRPQLNKESSAKSLLDYAASLTDTEQFDGEKYHYRTVLTNVLGMVIERAAKTPLQQLLEEHLWRRLGPEQDLAVVVDALGFPYVGAGGNACARDLYRFGAMLAARGTNLNGERVVPQAWIDETRNGDDEGRALLAASDYADMMPGGHYRNQMWVADAKLGVIHAIGIHGQTIYSNLTTGVVVVKLSSHPESADMPLFADTFLAMDALSEQLAVAHNFGAQK